MRSSSTVFRALLVGVGVALWSAVPSGRALAFGNGQAAYLVLGQTDFTSAASGSGLAQMSLPCAVAVDPTSGKVFVADAGNNRVLRFASSAVFVNGAAAEAMLGTGIAGVTATAMSGPRGVHVDSSGRLWVADSLNHRVLRFDGAAALASGAAANGVLGQADFTTANVSTPSASTMNQPQGVYADAAGALFVADAINNRVLRFAAAAGLANGGSATTVIGQADFTSFASAVSQTGMDFPSAVYLDSGGRLWVADRNNNRVLQFSSGAVLMNGPLAAVVLGQPDFTTGIPVVSQSGMNSPSGVFGDALGRLFVADSGSNRVLVHDDAASKSSGANADSVLGQANFTTATLAPTSASTLSAPQRLVYDDALNALLVADALANRVLGYTVCRNGMLDAGETCDDGNQTNGDCCDLGCHSETGMPCAADASACTADVCDGAGQCTHQLPTCNNETFAGASIKIKDGGSNPNASLVTLKLKRGNLSLVELGDPTTSEDYTVCIHDDAGPVTEITVAGGAQCGSVPCWVFTGPVGAETGVKFKDPQNPPANDGLKKLLAKTSASAKAVVKVIGKGPNLPVPALDVTYPVHARVVTEGGACFGFTFTANDEKVNDGALFKAVHP